jgi:phenylacetate-coenzyme A ligase PaaK-like adenylate-forming protein
LNSNVKNIELENKIFEVSPQNFEAMAIEVFTYQYKNTPVYNQYCQQLQIDASTIQSIEQIPFLPISMFKSHVVCNKEGAANIIFESSGTTTSINSKHYVVDATLYERSFLQSFQQFYGDATNWCIIGLLPSYLERTNSSLVYMVNQLIKDSQHLKSGFYLNNFSALATTLQQLEKEKMPTLVIGVTFALLDFAATYPQQLQYTTIMETGGMKGRREEITREAVHQQLMEAFGLSTIHSEYGMTELLSQSYSNGKGIFKSPNWKKILIREEDDPFAVHAAKENIILSGAANIIDLANLYACSFIATDDAAKLHGNGNFEIIGRLDNSTVRGCSLLVV